MVSPPIPDGSAPGAGRHHASDLPEIPECRVERLPDGRLLLTHKGTGRTAEARDDDEDPVIQGVILRCLPYLAAPSPEFRAGDLP